MPKQELRLFYPSTSVCLIVQLKPCFEMLILIPCNCITCQADAIISKFQKTENLEKDVNPTILVAADTVCLASFAFSN